MANNQAYLFIIFTINGFLIGILFDIFRILRKTFKTKDIITYIEDILFWVITGIIIIYSMYTFCNGKLRFFMIIGIIIGVAIYIFTLSKYVIKISVYILTILKKILKIPFKIIYNLTKEVYNMTRKIIIRQIMIICINIRKNIVNYIKKLRGFFIKK